MGPSEGLRRRDFIKLTALGGGVLLLAACGTSPAAPAKANPTASGSSGQAATTAATPPITQAVVNPIPANVKLATDQTARYVYSEPTHLDPGLATSGNEVYLIYEIWEGLLAYDAQGNTIPLGATKWDISPDGTVYTFHLRDGVKWTDGTPVTAHDYEWTWKRNLDPKTASEYAEALYIVKNAKPFNEGKITDASQVGVKALDDKTFQVTLEGPAGYFLRIASTWTAMPLPQTAVTKYGAKWVEAANIISNGPFKMTEWNHDQQITLTRNEGYWGQKPTLEKVTIKITPDIPKTSLPGFENNELDFAIGPWPADMDRIKSDPTLSQQLHVFPGSATEFVVCDVTNPNSPVSKADFRRALYLALDRDKIVNNVFNGIYTPAYTILPDDILGHNPAARIQGTVKDAQDALAKAGYPGGKGATLTMVYSQTSTNDLLAQVMQQMWQTNLGIKVNINPMESKAFTALWNTWTTAHYDLYFSSWGSDYLDPFDWMNFLFTTGTDFYHAHWSNADFDKLCDQAATALDTAKRGQLYGQAETILVNDAAYIPLYHTGTPYLIKPWVLNYIWQTVGGRPFKYIEIAQH